MNDNMRKFVRGLMVSTVSKGVLPKKREPVAYLYNGVRLPPLPEWDREKYLYALIRNASSQAHLYCFSDFYCCDDNYLPTDPMRLHVSSDYFSCRAPHYDTLWIDPTYGESGGPSWGFSTITWTNFDVLNEDGTVYLAASEPVPVYE